LVEQGLRLIPEFLIESPFWKTRQDLKDGSARPHRRITEKCPSSPGVKLVVEKMGKVEERPVWGIVVGRQHFEEDFIRALYRLLI
jgi:hypothetical protein